MELLPCHAEKVLTSWVESPAAMHHPVQPQKSLYRIMVLAVMLRDTFALGLVPLPCVTSFSIPCAAQATALWPVPIMPALKFCMYSMRCCCWAQYNSPWDL